MKQFKFSAWSMRDLAENTLTGGGYNYHDMKITQIDGKTVLAMADRKSVGHRVKFAEAFEDAAKGNRYRISVQVRLGEECSVDETEVTVLSAKGRLLSEWTDAAGVAASNAGWSPISYIVNPHVRALRLIVMTTRCQAPCVTTCGDGAVLAESTSAFQYT